MDIINITPPVFANDPHQSIFKASTSISAEGLITGGNAENIQFIAGSEIELKPGFEVQVGGQLLIDIENCIPLARKKEWPKEW